MTLIDAMRARRIEAHRLSNAIAAVADNGLGDALRHAFLPALAETPDPCSCALLGLLCDHGDENGADGVNRNGDDSRAGHA